MLVSGAHPVQARGGGRLDAGPARPPRTHAGLAARVAARHLGRQRRHRVAARARVRARRAGPDAASADVGQVWEVDPLGRDVGPAHLRLRRRLPGRAPRRPAGAARLHRRQLVLVLFAAQRTQHAADATHRVGRAARRTRRGRPDAAGGHARERAPAGRPCPRHHAGAAGIRRHRAADGNRVADARRRRPAGRPRREFRARLARPRRVERRRRRAVSRAVHPPGDVAPAGAAAAAGRDQGAGSRRGHVRPQLPAGAAPQRRAARRRVARPARGRRPGRAPAGDTAPRPAGQPAMVGALRRWRPPHHGAPAPPSRRSADARLGRRAGALGVPAVGAVAGDHHRGRAASGPRTPS